MNVIIPLKFKDTKLSEREAMFIAFMTLVGEEHGYEHSYNICAWDIAKMLGAGNLVFESPILDNLKEIFKFVNLNDENWVVTWKDFKREDWYTYSGRGSLKQYKYKLTTVRNISMWAYLLGLFRGSKDLIQDSHKLFEHENVYRHSMT